MPEVQLRGAEVDGLTIHYVSEGRGPAVVLLHGLGGFAESWRHNIPALARVATVYAVDLPGFGHSSKPPARYRLADSARAVHGFVEAMGLGRVAIVGHSLGAAVGVTYALTHPARVERLALIGALVPGAPYRPSLPYRLAATHVLGELLALCGCAPLYRAALARCFHAPVAEEVEFLVREGYAARTQCGGEGRVPRHAARHPPRLRRARARLPARARDARSARALDPRSAGPRDPRPCTAARRRRRCRARAVRWIDACGHFPQIEHASVVNGWLTEFLVGRPAPR